jgi:hypothetical protein
VGGWVAMVAMVEVVERRGTKADAHLQRGPRVQQHRHSSKQQLANQLLGFPPPRAGAVAVIQEAISPHGVFAAGAKQRCLVPKQHQEDGQRQANDIQKDHDDAVDGVAPPAPPSSKPNGGRAAQ